jgi:hypothetical protein
MRFTDPDEVGMSHQVSFQLLKAYIGDLGVLSRDDLDVVEQCLKIYNLTVILNSPTPSINRMYRSFRLMNLVSGFIIFTFHFSNP